MELIKINGVRFYGSPDCLFTADPDNEPPRVERFAVVTGRAVASREMVERQIEAYLPSGYVVGVVESTDPGHWRVEINGYDEAGWTLDGYVLPRLASGLWFGQEVFPALV